LDHYNSAKLREARLKGIEQANGGTLKGAQ
jgi:hypothetical protein